MERVAFLLEDTGERLGCLLNPETLVVRRRAGVRRRESVGGLVTGADRADDPLLYTGGGTTELTLDLVFDVSLAGSSISTEDVRDLTRPLWDLAENRRRGRVYSRPPLCRFVWGKSWNVPGIITAVAERLEAFTAGGAPARSWLRMRLLRVVEPRTASTQGGVIQPPGATELPQAGPRMTTEVLETHELIGGGSDAAGGERLDQLAQRYYGDASRWRELAASSGLDDPLRAPAGHPVQIPPASER